MSFVNIIWFFSILGMTLTIIPFLLAILDIIKPIKRLFWKCSKLI